MAHKTKRSQRNKMTVKRGDEDRDTRGRVKQMPSYKRGNGRQDVRRIDLGDR